MKKSMSTARVNKNWTESYITQADIDTLTGIIMTSTSSYFEPTPTNFIGDMDKGGKLDVSNIVENRK